MEDTETELTSSEPDALGADFITVELDTQPIEYVVKWAEVGSKFTISCVKKESDENNCFVSDQLVKTEPEERFFAPYESVYPGCGDAETSLIASQEEEVKSDSDVEESMELGSSQLVGEEQEEEEGSEGDWEKGGSHSRDRPYCCHLCGKSYSHSSSLARHLHMHSRLHTCSTCGKTFNHSSSLSRHRLIHKLCSRDKPNCYTLCKKSKRGKGSKKRPPSHGGERRYACNVCKKAFVRLSNLKQHQQTHASGKLYECQHCGKTFVHSSSFSRHKKVHAGPKADPRQRKRGRVIDESAPLESESE
uniref:C2H2-type domain-containing protein n=1 Tax=Electrophorus electricus TaxID=8005 RepID=A0AAY5F1K7_ELEEL